MRSLRLYLAGPMTGIPQYNFPAFDQAAAVLRDIGYDVVNPTETDPEDVQDLARASTNGDPTTDGISHLEPLEVTAVRNVHEVVGCDAVALLNGWHRSPGTRHEVETAHRFGKPVAPVFLWTLAGFHMTDTREAVLYG
ncbi:MAG: DUF4406 domain-containing protein [candidate division NC10 bacterium]